MVKIGFCYNLIQNLIKNFTYPNYFIKLDKLVIY